MDTCPECQGSGFEHEQPPACHVCQGTGEVMRSVMRPSQRVPYASKREMQLGVCPGCSGQGVAQPPACRSCGGKGRVKGQRDVKISIPPGVSEHTLLRFDGMGGVGRYGGPSGSLLVKLEVHPEVNMERKGDDLYSSLQVGVFEVLLGGKLRVDTVRGKRWLNVPPGSQPGDVLRLEGAGVVRGSGLAAHRGDHYFTLHTRLPSVDEMGPGAEQLLRRLAAVDTTISGSDNDSNDSVDSGDDQAGGEGMGAAGTRGEHGGAGAGGSGDSSRGNGGVGRTDGGGAGVREGGELRSYDDVFGIKRTRRRPL